MPNGNGKKKNGNGNGNNKSSQKKGASRRRRGGGSAFNGRMQTTVQPIAYGSENVRKIQNQRFVHSGSDFMGTVSVRGDLSDPTDRILFSFPITPSGYPGTRLTQFASLYEFFKFTNLRLRYVPAVPTTLACQLILYVDLDPSDDPTTITNPLALIRQATAQTGAQQWNFHTPKSIPMAMRTDQQFYFTGEDKQNARFSQQGRAYLIQVTQALDFNGTPIEGTLEAGSVFFDWTCAFNIPQIDASSVLAKYDLPETSTTYVRTVSGGAWRPTFLSGGEPFLRPRTSYTLTPFYATNIPDDSGVLSYQYQERTLSSYSTLAADSSVTMSGPGTMLIETDRTGRVIGASEDGTTGDFLVSPTAAWEATPGDMGFPYQPY